MPASCSNELDRRTWSDREQKRFLYTLVVSNFIFYLEIVKKKEVYIYNEMSWKGKCTNEVQMAEQHELETMLESWEIWCWCCWNTQKVDGANNVFRTFYISFSNKI